MLLQLFLFPFSCFNNCNQNMFGVLRIMDVKVFLSRYPVSCNNIIQYSVSLASFKAMLILWMKSLRDSPCMASFTKAPMAVPERNNCLLKTYSLWLFCKNLQQLTILIAN